MTGIDAQLVDLCVALYAGSDGFDHVDLGLDDGVAWGLKHLAEADAVILRGSVTVADWIHDGQAVSTVVPHYEALGPVHAGFAIGMPQMWGELADMLRQTHPVWIGGHSLGAARACILAGMMLAEGIEPDACVRFGEPRPGFAPLAALLNRADMYQASYRNAGPWGHDYVTDVPFALGAFPYTHPIPLTDVDAPPTGELMQRFGLFAGHHASLYASALHQLDTKAAA